MADLRTPTPKPWTVQVPPASSGFGRAIYHVTEDGPDLFVAYVGNWSQSPFREVADANLIAASQDLIDALPTDDFFDLIRAGLRTDAGIAYHRLEHVARACREARAKAEDGTNG
jgi:hypothetical protein